MYIILMGAQGSGKGTQAALLGPRLKLVKIATGDLFRAEIASGSDLGLELKGVLDRGELVEDGLTNAIVRGKIEGIVKDMEDGEDVHGALFDGFPRNAAQAASLDGILSEFGQSITGVIEIDVPRDILIERLSGRRVCVNGDAVYHIEADPSQVDGICNTCGGQLVQRDDDKPDAIARRLAIYDEQTAPLLAYYAERDLVDRVNGDQPVDAVQAEIIQAISGRTDAL